jgi:dimethylamine/trimethylamine dehydrogenase
LRDPRYDPLFESVRIGPVTAPNRFYQVPHCTGMGFGLPRTLAAMRGIKAEGGWGVVNTEYCSIDPSSDDTPAPYASLWDEDDVRNMAAMADAVHAHGALAGVELWHGGIRSSNGLTRARSLGPQSLPCSGDPWQAQAMDKSDIADLRKSHRAAALRAKEAGLDIVYVYAAHTYLLAQFLDPRINNRRDEYGGAIENRARLVRELAHETRDAIGGSCAVAIRIEADNEGGGGEDRLALFEMLKEGIDLFDVTVSDYSREMGVSRFIEEGSLEAAIAHVRKLTGKPVVSVGRFTSPDSMLSQVRRGILDFVGAARPSIADPFLPRKIADGRMEDIRECIGCNICYACDGRGVPIRCTQNPAMGEEWRRGWHPERVNIATSREKVLIVGAGPSGLEAAHILGKRGHEVMLADAAREPGGRVNWESRLPGLQEWARVRDYRLAQLAKLPNVGLFPESRMSAGDAVEAGAGHVVVATGSRWRRDGRGRNSAAAVAMDEAGLLAPEDVMAGAAIPGPVVIYDEDHYYVASALAERLAKEGHQVAYVTDAGIASAWSVYTAEQPRVQRRLAECGVALHFNMVLAGYSDGEAGFADAFSGKAMSLAAACFIPVTSREPDDALWTDLQGHAAFKSVRRIGDCRAPGLIAQAVFDGHEAGRMIGDPPEFHAIKRERVVVAAA